VSRRFKNRHAKVQADPHARAPQNLDHVPPELDDSNSFVPFEQPDMRIANELNARAFVTAGSAQFADDEAADAEGDDE
jgi:hypothetical protein